MAEIVEWPLEGATVTTAYDLLKDSLPIVSWTVRHPSLGALTIPAGDLSREERERVAGALRGSR